MPIISLEWDQSTRLFRLPVLVGIKVPSAVKTPATPPFIKAMFYLDTGSGISAVTDGEISKLGIDYNSLPTQQLAGVGGFTQGHFLTNVTFTVFTNVGPETVNLPKINVMPSEISKKVETGRGIYKRRGTQSAKMICLLGIDFLETIKGVLNLDFVNKKGEISY
ncbi:MAG: hypothetical protein AMDU3_IPLC00004G0039 [Thermoplasmatales archaeon I-plasma]|jgi:hypothetical protein|nr:MAG: hypothetical protein AMDU3_IPLC00004G0039 [Thermoplasmatales archaeon I-plasma]